jgi:hypothetical protein
MDCDHLGASKLKVIGGIVWIESNRLECITNELE